jgi:hypothetical protein
LLLTEALRRAVEIRDAEGSLQVAGSRGTLLVDVLNELATALHYEVGDIWNGFDNHLE